MVFMFYKIEQLNKEYLTTVDDNQITMKDFAIMCTNVKLDRYTQDSRLIKMKIWLHFTRLFQNRELMADHEELDSDEEEEEEEELCEGTDNNTSDKKTGKGHRKNACFKRHPIHQVLDVCLSIYT